jgi:phosphatidylglycerol:prolipoprotein diacylglycerol transferase
LEELMLPQWDPSLFWTAGVLAGLYALDEMARRDGLVRRAAFLCGLLVATAGWLGARGVGVFSYADAELGLMGGRSWFGALLGGIAGALVASRIAGVQLRTWLDAAAPAVCAGYALGRLGCLFNGCDFGTVTTVPWAVHYAPGFPAFDKHLAAGMIALGATASLGVHPVQFYLAAGALVLWAVLLRLPARRFPALLVGYASLRLLLEPLRGDSVALFATLSQTQWFALFSLLCGAVLLVTPPRPAIARAA